MNYLFKKGDKVVLQQGTYKGHEATVRYAVRLDEVDTPRFVRVPKVYLEPANPTPAQAKYYLNKSLEALIVHAKEKLVLLNHSIKWAQKCKELGVRHEPQPTTTPDPVVEQRKP